LIRTNRAQRALGAFGGVLFICTPSKRIESGGLSVPLSPEKIRENFDGIYYNY